jgi:valyl-tRNA synthetase
MLDKSFDAAAAEAAIYAAWERSGAFAPKAGKGEPFAVMMPPPNVTGSLHIGHALDQTIQDALTRYHRMRGQPTLWQPGTDHAGIATQMMVERKLAAEGRDRRSIGRDAFLAECWAWKEASHGNILSQLKRLGASPDWNRERFTMDEGLSKAVTRAFVQLYKEGLIYKDKRLVNWDVELQTAVSDLETVPVEVNGQLWHLDYPLADDPDRVITVATTRPETMLGDTAVAVHPEDARYQALVGRHVVLPLVGRHIPIVADTYSDPDKGTGAVKITPAHDFNDFEVGRRHGLEAIAILDAQGHVNANAPEVYRGLDRFAARQRIVADLEAAGRLRKVESYRHTVPHGDRSNSVLEPYLTDQWYCDAATLAAPAIAAVESGRTVFVPPQWQNTYFEWMRNIQPWCISRQLWWGHRIPAWYGPDGRIFVAESEAEAEAAAVAHYGCTVELTRDPDVLDTWFSSGLWPFSTLGWPEPTPELERFYPGTVLVTGFDIIFFWVARMMMQGLHFMGDVPFRVVHIHGLVRDEKGQKMSKTKGNVVDPLALIDKYGADALRVALLASTAHGRDIKFGESRVEGYRNFTTKLWNAARFAELNGVELDPDFRPETASLTLNRWIVGETAKAAAATTVAIDGYRFNDAALGLYHFVWNDLCDWYIELAKPVLAAEESAAKRETQRVLGWVLAQSLHLLHPLAPFVSEALWQDLFGAPGGMLIEAAWPLLDADGLVDPDAAAEIDWLIRLITGIRAARNEVNVPAGARLRLEVQGAGETTAGRLATHDEAICRLARLEAVSATGSLPAKSLQLVVDEASYALPVGDVVDLEVERQRLGREVDKLIGEAGKLKAKLGNTSFLERAPEAVIEEQRERLAETEATAARLKAALARIA